MLDVMGNISLSLQVAILFLLILGLPLVKGVGGKKNLMRHGYLTVIALILHTILIFWAMVPTLLYGLPDIASLPVLSAIDVWSHVILGIFAEVLGIIIVVFWFSKPLTLMNCAKMKKWMLPLFIVWMISLVNGSLIHILGLL
ncbi:MAG: hypothetical protein ACM3WQ_07020 [Chloroflexota bacterium]